MQLKARLRNVRTNPPAPAEQDPTTLLRTARSAPLPHNRRTAPEPSRTSEVARGAGAGQGHKMAAAGQGQEMAAEGARPAQQEGRGSPGALLHTAAPRLLLYQGDLVTASLATALEGYEVRGTGAPHPAARRPPPGQWRRGGAGGRPGRGSCSPEAALPHRAARGGGTRRGSARSSPALGTPAARAGEAVPVKLKSGASWKAT